MPSRPAPTSPSRRTLLALLIAGLTQGIAAPAFGQTAGSARTTKVIVGSPAGSLGDVLARLVADKLREAGGHTTLVDNRPGAAGALAADAVARSPGDGSTLLVAPDAVMVVNPFVYAKLPYDPVRDFQPVALLGKASLVLLASPTLKVKTFEDFVRLAKSQPKAINYGSGGAGHPTHILMELINNRTGIQLTHVPYKGTTPALQDLMSGQIGVMVAGMVEALPQIKAGNVVPLAASGPTAKENLPGVPELKDFHPDLNLSVWFAVFAPASTPPALVRTLNAEINTAWQQPDVRKRLADFGLVPQPSTPAELTQLMAQDRERFGPLVKSLGLVVE